MAATEAARREASQVANTMHLAMSLIAAKIMRDTLASFNQVSTKPSAIASTGGTWLAKATAATLQARTNLQQVTLAGYRLHRALLTQATVQVGAGKADTLDGLRSEFRELVKEFAPQALDGLKPGASILSPFRRADGSEHTPSDPRVQIEPWQPDSADGRVTVEQIDGLSDKLDRERKRVEQETRNRLWLLGPDRLTKLLNALDDPSVQDIEEIHSKSAEMAAKDAGRIASNGDRGIMDLIAEQDQRVLGYARVQGGEDSCAFCGMLISMGFIPARGNTDPSMPVDGYHPGCDCSIELFYDEEDWLNSPHKANADRMSELYAQAQRQRKTSDDDTKNPAYTAYRRYLRENKNN